MKKIVILPYHTSNLTTDLSYLSEGILEELIYLISSTGKLSTSSRSTSLYLKNNPIPHDEIKARFQANYVLEGNIRHINNTYQLSSQLFDASTETLLLNTRVEFHPDKWTQPLDQLVRDISLTINGSEPANPYPEKDTSEARELYQQGLFHWHRYTHEEMQLAIKYFKRSIKENEDFALPYAATADSYSIMGIMGYEEPQKVFELAKKSVQKALTLNNKRSESYVSAAFVNMFYDRDYDRAKVNLTQALKLNKDNLKVQHAMAMYHIHAGQLKEAEKHSATTIRLDPLALPHYAMMMRINIYQKKYTEAIDYAQAALNIDAQASTFVELRAYANLFLGNTESAIEGFADCLKQAPQNLLYIANLAYAYSKAGFHYESRETEARLLQVTTNKNTGVFDFALAIVKLGQTDYDASFRHIYKAVEYRIGVVPGELRCHPMFIEVRKDSRFQELLDTCNLSIESTKAPQTRKLSAVVTLRKCFKTIHSLFSMILIIAKCTKFTEL